MLPFEDYEKSKCNQEILLRLFLPKQYDKLKNKIKFNKYLYEVINNCYTIANNKKQYNMIIESMNNSIIFV